MTVQAMVEVIERAATDAEFKSALRTNPRAVLASYELTPSEVDALMSGRRVTLRAAGLDAETAGRPLALWRGKDEPGVPGDTLNPQHVQRPSTTEAGVATRG